MNRVLKKFYNVVLISSCIYVGALADQPPIPGLPPMSNTEMQQLEAELAELNKMMEGMSEEEQAQFLDSMMQEAVQEVKKDLSDEGKELFDKLESGDISDEDFNKLLNELMPPQEQKPQESKPEPAKSVPAKKAPKPVVTSKHQAALDMINSLIKNTNLFLQKVATIPELPGKIAQWEKEKKLDWKSGLTWNNFRANLDSFVSKLGTLKEQDKNSDQYRHIDELLKNETLYNNLSKIEKKAAEYQPKIEEVPLVGEQKVPESSKKAVQALISQYIEALYVLNLPQELDALFKKFEPQAKKEREAQEEAQKKAEEELKKERRAGKTVTGGTTQEVPYYPPFEEYDDFGSYFPAQEEPFIPEYEQPAPSFYDATQKEQKASTPNAKSEAQKEVAPKEKDKEKETLTHAISTKPQEKKGTVSTVTKKKAEKEDPMAKAVKPLADAATMVTDNKVFDTLNEKIQKEDIDTNLINDVLPDLYLQLKSAARSLNDFAQKNKNEPAHKRKKLAQNLKDESAAYLNKINPLVAKIDNLENIQTQLPLIKRYAYFGEVMDQQAILDQIAALITNEPVIPQEIINRFVVIANDPALGVSQALTYVEEQIKSLPIDQATRNKFSQMSSDIDLWARHSREPIATSLPQIKQLINQINSTIDNFAK